MSNYDIAWIVVVAFGVMGAFGLSRLLPNLKPVVRYPLLSLVFALFVLPAPIPRFEGEYAPALIVFVFELLFQIDGEPNTAGGILLIGGVASLTIAAVIALILSRRSTRDDTDQADSPRAAKISR